MDFINSSVFIVVPPVADVVAEVPTTDAEPVGGTPVVIVGGAVVTVETI